MKEQKYPNYEEHKGYHKKLINELTEFTARHTADKTSVTPPEIAAIPEGWLINHIQKADFADKPFMPPEEWSEC